MVKAELIKRSPLRILEKFIKSDLGKGNIVVLASRKGIGKTACLVHIATEKLFQEKHVIHVSYSSRVDYIINRYEDIFKEISKKINLESAVKVHDDIIKNRVIMNFKQEGTKTAQLLKSIEAMIKFGNFKADSLIIDGYDFTRSKKEDLKIFKEFARENSLEIWFSASLKGDEPLFNELGVPFVLHEFIEEIDVLITLKFKDNYVKFYLVKDNDFPVPNELHLKLDPKTLLIIKDVE